ncbi:hypothetical protein HU200_016683 [Digitaria exilis]|uniref:PGG domain-containing protein n=1 Tax=Digitaria exilis TaxID=1010633 RepID=A0A835F788_9POAL|nr:hypothetical protein HU200_016683 [Digitaria exilis]
MLVSLPVVVSIASPALQVNIELLEAATSGDVRSIPAMASQGSRLLLGITRLGNDQEQQQSIVGQTPLITGSRSSSSGGARMNNVLLNAATYGDVASMEDLAADDPAMLLATNPQGNTCLHIASMHGHITFCSDAIVLNKSLLGVVNKDGETPLLVAVTSGHDDLASLILSQCLAWEQGSDSILQQDKHGCNALHHAIRSGLTELALELIAAEPNLSKAVNSDKESPMFIAARRDFMDIFEQLLSIHDSAHCGALGHNVLHAAVCNDNPGIVRRIMETRPGLAKEEDFAEMTPVRAAAYENKIDILRLFLEHDQSLGYLMTTSALFFLKDHNHINEVYMLLRKADPNIVTSPYILHGAVKNKVTDKSRKDIKALTTKYTNNTSLVAILIATITFAAAFTLPGGYKSDGADEGHPILARNLAFQAFLISDTLAMCSSLVVAFVGIMANWEDLEFLLYYRSFTIRLMWFAYMATTIAFSTGLYTVLAPRLLWLAVPVCLLTALLPILTMVLGEWPIWKLRIQLRQNFMSDLLDMV